MWYQVIQFICGFCAGYISLFWPFPRVPFYPALFIRLVCVITCVYCIWKLTQDFHTNASETEPEYVSLYEATKKLYTTAKNAVTVWRTMEEVETCGMPRESVLTIGETKLKAGEDPEALTAYLQDMLDNLTEEYGKQLVVLCLLWKRGFGGPPPSPTADRDDEILIDSSKKIVRQSYDYLTQDDVEGVFYDVRQTEDIRQLDEEPDDEEPEDEEKQITDDGSLYWFVYAEREGEAFIACLKSKEEAENVYNNEVEKGGDVYAPVETTWTGICKRHGKDLKNMRYVMDGESENE